MTAAQIIAEEREKNRQALRDCQIVLTAAYNRAFRQIFREEREVVLEAENRMWAAIKRDLAEDNALFTRAFHARMT